MKVTEHMIACDQPGCDETMRSLISLDQARMLARVHGWAHGPDERGVMRDWCPKHADQEREETVQ